MLIVFARHVSIAAGIVCSSWVWQQAQHGQVLLPEIKSATLHPVHMGKCLTPAKSIWVCYWGMLWLIIEVGVWKFPIFLQTRPSKQQKQVRSKPSKPSESKPSFFGTECRSLNIEGMKNVQENQVVELIRSLLLRWKVRTWWTWEIWVPKQVGKTFKTLHLVGKSLKILDWKLGKKWEIP